MRLNDEIPMDFGGFCKFFDKSVFSSNDDDEEGLQNMENFHNGDELFEYLICLVIMAAKPEYPLIDFVRNLYRIEDNDNGSDICDVVDQIEKNLDRKYKDVMVKLYEKKNTPVAASSKPDYRRNERPAKSEPKKEEEENSSSSSSDDNSDNSDNSEERQRRDKKRGKESRERGGRDK